MPWLPSKRGPSISETSWFTSTVTMRWQSRFLQAGPGRDPFIQACAQQLWLVCGSHDITLAVGDIAAELLIFSSDALSHWHMGQQYKDRVNMFIKDNGVNIISVSPDAFVLSCSL